MKGRIKTQTRASSPGQGGRATYHPVPAAVALGVSFRDQDFVQSGGHSCSATAGCHRER